MGMSGGGGGGTNGGTGGALYSLSAYLSGSGGASSSSVLTTLLLFKLSAVSFFNVGRREDRPNMPTDPRMREEEEAAPIEVSRSAPSRLLMARSPRLETSANTEAINTDGHKDDARDEDADADADDVERGILKLISYPARPVNVQTNSMDPS